MSKKFQKISKKFQNKKILIFNLKNTEVKIIYKVLKILNMKKLNINLKY